MGSSCGNYAVSRPIGEGEGEGGREGGLLFVQLFVRPYFHLLLLHAIAQCHCSVGEICSIALQDQI